MRTTIMDPGKLGEVVLMTVYALIGALVFYNIVVFIAQRFLYVCAPNEILVFSGGKYPHVDGSTRGFKVVFGGRAWRAPFVERVDRMDLTTIPLELTVSNAYSKGNIAMRVHAIATVKISSDRTLVMNAVERFLGRGKGEVQQVARETLEGNLRGIVATMTPEELNEDRLAFADRVSAEVHGDLAKLGIELDTLKIQSVSDEMNYLNSIGRADIANVIKRAEMAESDATREADKVSAEATAVAEVAEAEASQAITERLNALRAIEAQLKAQVEAEQLKAQAAAAEARSIAELDLQEIRREREKLRLQADVVIPADAERQASEMRAKGDVAPIEARGLASADALKALALAWQEAGPNADQIYLISQIEKLTELAANAVNKVDVKHIHLIDDGRGTAVPALMAAFPMAMAEVMKSVQANLGIDITGALARRDKAALSAEAMPDANARPPIV